jgi:hypothetical protein
MIEIDVDDPTMVTFLGFEDSTAVYSGRSTPIVSP